MAVDVMTDIVIDRPRDEVAAFVADPSHAPAWYVNITSVEWRTPPPLSVGSRVAFIARFLGRTLAYTYEIVEHSPGRRLVMRTAEGPFPMRSLRILQARGSAHGRRHAPGQPQGSPASQTAARGHLSHTEGQGSDPYLPLHAD